MADSTERYLASDRAVADLAAQIARENIGADDAMRDRWTLTEGVIGDRSCPWRMVFCMGGDVDEMSIAYPVRSAICAYFRPEGDHYIVTDLGEAVRALRLRTGQLDIWWSDLDFEMPDGAYGDDARFLLAKGRAGQYAVDPAALPRAICAVMLAAYRVSRLEVPRG